MTPQWATVLLSVLALAFSIYSGIRANGKTDRKDAEEAGKQESAVMMKLEVVQNTLLEVKQDIKSQKLEMEKMNERTGDTRNTLNKESSAEGREGVLPYARKEKTT